MKTKSFFYIAIAWAALLLPLTTAFADQRKDLVVCVTVPKAGTHLLIKCITLMNIDGITYDYNTEKNPQVRKQRKMEKITLEEYADRAFSRLFKRMDRKQRRSFLVHLPFTTKHKAFFDENTVANFLMMRDPRDQLISVAATSLKDPTNREVGLKETLLELLDGNQKLTPWWPRHRGSDLVWSVGIVNFYRAFLKWANEPNFYVVHFEKLIGPQGGGTVQEQRQEIKNIGRHLGVTLTEAQVDHVVQNLFGGTLTFKKGQGKAWKKYFTPDVTEAFKKVPGACQLLIDLGYEKDCNW